MIRTSWITVSQSYRKATGVLASASKKFEGSVNHAPISSFAWLTLLYLIVVVSLSSMKLLWLDELITLHIARLSSVGAIWRALGQGADPNPPLTHILVHFIRRFFGERELALRIPAITVYWVGLLSLFLYLRRRIPAVWALGGTALSMTMAAFDYSYESRSYAIFYGFAMLAFYCWSVAVDSAQSLRAQRSALAGMIFALAAGISTNYFAVLAFLPIAAGEFTRLARRGYARLKNSSGILAAAPAQWFDFRIIIGLLVAATPLLFYRPLIEHSIAQFGPYAWNKVSVGQVSDSYTEMVEIALYPILALFLCGLLFRIITWSLSPLSQSSRAAIRPRWLGVLFTPSRLELPFPVHELIGIAFLMAYPVLGYIVASIRGGMLSPRFVIPVCLGFAIAATLTAFDMLRRIPHASTAFLCLWLAWFVSREAVVGYWYQEQKQCFYKVLAHLPEADRSVPDGSPIVVPDPLMALTFQHYAPPEVASRVVFPVDFAAIRHYRLNDSPEQNLWAGRDSLYTMPIVPLADFESHVGPYLILGSDGNWLLQDLDAHRYPVKRLDINTRAGAMEFFTPLFHGTPVFYVASGDIVADQAAAASGNSPIRFSATDNLPAPILLTKNQEAR